MRGERIAGRAMGDEGTLIFCGISVLLWLVALSAAALGGASAVMS